MQLLSDNLASWVGLMPRDPHKVIMQQAPANSRTPLIVWFFDSEQFQDGHIGESEARTVFVNEAKRHLDPPIVIHENFANNVTAVDLGRPSQYSKIEYRVFLLVSLNNGMLWFGERTIHRRGVLQTSICRVCRYWRKFPWCNLGCGSIKAYRHVTDIPSNGLTLHVNSLQKHPNVMRFKLIEISLMYSVTDVPLSVNFRRGWNLLYWRQDCWPHRHWRVWHLQLGVPMQK